MNSKNKGSFFSVLFIAAIDSFGLGIVFVLFGPLLLSPEYHFVPPETSIGMRNLYLGILFASYPLSQLFGAPILGDFADRAGRKKALYISLIGVTIGFLLSGMACVISSLTYLIISRFLSGFFAGNLSICLSSIADMSPTEKKRSFNFGMLTVVFALSWYFAVIVAGYLSDPTQSRYFSAALPFWVSAFLSFLSLVVLARFFTETHGTKGRARFDIIKGIHNIKHAFQLKTIRPFFLVYLLWTVGWGLTVQWFAAYSILEYQVSQAKISWMLVIQGVFWTLGGAVINPLLLKRYKTLTIAIIAYLFCSLFLFLAAIPHHYLTFCVLYWISAIFASFALSNSNNLISIHAEEAIQGKVMGLSQSMMALGWILVPLIGGYIGADHAVWFYPIGGLLLAIALFILLFKKRAKKKIASS